MSPAVPSGTPAGDPVPEPASDWTHTVAASCLCRDSTHRERQAGGRGDGDGGPSTVRHQLSVQTGPAPCKPWGPAPGISSSARGVNCGQRARGPEVSRHLRPSEGSCEQAVLGRTSPPAPDCGPLAREMLGLGTLWHQQVTKPQAGTTAVSGLRSGHDTTRFCSVSGRETGCHGGPSGSRGRHGVQRKRRMPAAAPTLGTNGRQLAVSIGERSAARGTLPATRGPTGVTPAGAVVWWGPRLRGTRRVYSGCHGAEPEVPGWRVGPDGQQAERQRRDHGCLPPSRPLRAPCPRAGTARTREQGRAAPLSPLPSGGTGWPL